MKEKRRKEKEEDRKNKTNEINSNLQLLLNQYHVTISSEYAITQVNSSHV